jgi:hypothetical protein
MYLCEVTPEAFARDVNKHALAVFHHVGVYRHIRLADPATGNGSFNIITWPGYLAYSGDMGDYVFARTKDMFEFFRGHEPNLSYWAEKVQAQDKCSGVEEYSPAKAKEYFYDTLKEAYPGSGPDSDDPDFDQDEASVRADITALGLDAFDDMWEADFKEYTFRFQWCCHAIPYAIAMFDAWEKAHEVKP